MTKTCMARGEADLGRILWCGTHTTTTGAGSNTGQALGAPPAWGIAQAHGATPSEGVAAGSFTEMRRLPL